MTKLWRRSTWVLCHCGGALLLIHTVESEGKNCMLLGGNQKTVAVLHFPGGWSYFSSESSFLYQGITIGALLHGEVLEMLQSSVRSLAKLAASGASSQAPCR